MSRVLVTGASGFVGQALVNELAAQGQLVRAAMRQPADVFSRSVEVVAVSDLTRPVEWRTLLKDVTSVVHLAGISRATPNLTEDIYDRVNRLATAELAAAVHARTINRLIFVSSIRAQAGSASRQVLRETDIPRPTDAFGRSKLGAEEAVRKAKVPFTILRPVLVYGAGMKGNLLRLFELAQSPWPLPFSMFREQRSLLARQNLVEAIRFVLSDPKSVGETYIVADPSALTLPEIITAMRAGLGRSPRLFPVSPGMIGFALKMAGRTYEWERLGGNLTANPEKLLRAGWRPAIDTRAGLAAMTQTSVPSNSFR